MCVSTVKSPYYEAWVQIKESYKLYRDLLVIGMYQLVFKYTSVWDLGQQTKKIKLFSLINIFVCTGDCIIERAARISNF